MRNAIRLLAAALALVALPGGSGCEEGNLGDTSPGPVSFRASIDQQTVPADGPSSQPATSADGRFVAFASRATNLAFSEFGFQEIFVRDRLTDTTENVSLLSGVFTEADRADCLQPAISADGRWVLFRTTGGMNIFGGVQTTTNLFRWDRQNKELVAVLASWPIDDDVLNASISEDGLKIAFETGASTFGFPGGGPFVYVADYTGVLPGDPPVIILISHATGAPATQANARAQQPQISADGNFVVYQSQATNLTADATGGRRMVWLSASNGSSTELVSRNDGLGAALDNHCGLPSVSRDGRYVSFMYQGGSLAPAPPGGDLRFPVCRRDRGALPLPLTQAVATDCFAFALFSPIAGGPPTSISDDGRFIAYMSTDAPPHSDLFVRVRDVQAGTFNPSVSLIPAGGGTLNDFPTCVLSNDGRWVFWTSEFDRQVLNDTNGVADVFGFGPMR